MGDNTKLMADIAELNAKVDAILAKQNPPPIDDQSIIDQADEAVLAITAKIPA